jgi:hypothetical protein
MTQNCKCYTPLNKVVLVDTEDQCQLPFVIAKLEIYTAPKVLFNFNKIMIPLLVFLICRACCTQHLLFSNLRATCHRFLSWGILNIVSVSSWSNNTAVKWKSDCCPTCRGLQIHAIQIPEHRRLFILCSMLCNSASYLNCALYNKMQCSTSVKY